MKVKLKPISVRFEPEQHQQLEEIAQNLRRSKNWIIQEALRLYLEERADLEIALEKLQDPNTEYLDWKSAKNELLNQN